MTSVYNLLRETCGLSQQEAADFHDTRLDSVKSWCADRRAAPAGIIEELQDLMRRILQSAHQFAAILQRAGADVVIGMPVDELDATGCGFPSLGAQMRAIGIAVALLPEDTTINLVPREFGKTPMILLPDKEPDDGPDPAPGGFQTHVTSQPRRPRRRS